MYTICYMHDEALLRKILIANHQKITKARLTVFNLLRSKEPQAIASIIAGCKGEVDRVSVYRVLDLYEKLGIVKRVNIGWKYKIELSDAFLDHHHHASCLGCGKVMSVMENGELEALIEKLSAKSGLTMTSHVLELYGYCYACDTNTKNRT